MFEENGTERNIYAPQKAADWWKQKKDVNLTANTYCHIHTPNMYIVPTQLNTLTVKTQHCNTNYKLLKTLFSVSFITAEF
jgi:hypothetical protein